MPRDANGNYSLPFGNPVVTNTLITSTWANDTMSDLENEMQDSLSRSGKGGFTAPVGIVDKSGSIPGLYFLTEPTSGFKREAGGDLRIQVLGADNIRFLQTDRATDVWNNDLTTPAWERVFTTPTPNVLDADVEKTLQIKRETTPGVVPASLAEGELGVNVGDDPPGLYVGDGTGVKPLVDADVVRWPSGTKMLFYQDAAPAGWMIDEAVDEHSVRLTKGSVAGGITGGTSSGTYDFSAVFGSLAEGATPGVGDHQLNASELPFVSLPHDHNFTIRNANGSETLNTTNQFAIRDSALDSPGASTGITFSNGNMIESSSPSFGSDLPHGHTIDISVKWAACIVASKD